MSRKITFRKVKLQPEKKKFEFTWDKILLLVLIGAFILFYSINAIFDEADLRNIAGSAVSEEQGNSVQTADIRFAIEITNATHLDSERKFIRDITKEVKYLDGKWSQPVSDNEYVRVTFEQNLTSERDIRVYPRIVSGSPRIEVYEVGSDFIIAEFSSLTSNQYNKVFLTNLQNSQDSFDLKIVGGSIEIEHVIDPTEIKWADTNISGTFLNPNNALGATDGIWAGETNTNINVASNFSMENPSGGLTGTQTINVLARKGTNPNTPTITLNLFESGVFVQQIAAATSITSQTGQNVTGTFDASAITNQNNVEIEVIMTAAGGNPNSRNSAQIDSIRWDVNFAAPDPAPEVTINSPINTTYYTLLDFPLTLNVSLNENGSVMYSIDGGATNISLNTTDNQNFDGTLDAPGDGQYTFQVYANDTLGNNNYTENVVFTVATVNAIVNATVEHVEDGLINSTVIISYTNDTVIYNETNETHDEVILNASELYDIEIETLELNSIETIQLNEVNLSEVVGQTISVVELDRNSNNTEFGVVRAIDPLVNFTNGTLTIIPEDNILYECENWNFTSRACDGNWTLLASDLVPGEPYNITLNNESDSTGYGQIPIINALHLDENRDFISNIYEEVKSLNGVWSETISANHYVRVTFRDNLTSSNDITIYPRTVSGTPSIEVYENNESTLIANFTSINDNEYNQVLLTNLSGTQDVFDLHVVGGSVEFDHIVDPVVETTATTAGSGASATPVVNLPSGIVSGDLLIVLFRTAIGTNGVGWPGDWTELVESTADASDDAIAIGYRFANGTEGTTITLATLSAKFAAISYRISGAEDPAVQAPEVSAAATGTNTTPNPSPLSPTGGAKDYIWLWMGGWEGEQTSPPAGNPTSYTNPLGASSGTGGVVATNVRVASANRSLNAASEDPSSWTISASDDWTAWTLAVHPLSDKPPKWSQNTTNGTDAGTFIQHSINWTDNIGLSGYIFEFDNGNGSFFNDSFVTFTGTQNFSNVTKVVNSTVGSTIRWRVYANDSSNNLNSTSIFTYVTTLADATPPQFIFIPENISVYLNGSLNVDFNATDDGVLDSFFINWTTNFTINSSTGTLTNSSVLSVPGTYLINVSVNDTTGKTNSTLYKVTVRNTRTLPTAIQLLVGLNATNTNISYGYELIWKKPLVGTFDEFGGIVTEDRIGYTAGKTGNRNVSAFHALNGTLIWSTVVGSSDGTPVIDGNFLYINTYKENAATNGVYKLWKSNGTIAAQNHTCATGTSEGNGSTQTLAQSTNLIYGGCHDGFLYAYNKNDLTVNWSYNTTATGVATTPLYFGDTVTFGTRSNSVPFIQLNATNGSLIWNNSGWSATDKTWDMQPSIKDGVIYMASGSGGTGIGAFNSTNGTIIWNRTDIGGFFSQMAIYKDKLWAGGDNDTLYSLHKSNGTTFCSYKTGADIFQGPAIAEDNQGNGFVFFSSRDGNAYALNSTNCGLIWKYDINDNFGPPAVSEGIVYFKSDDTNIYAFNFGQGGGEWGYLGHDSSGRSFSFDGLQQWEYVNATCSTNGNTTCNISNAYRHDVNITFEINRTYTWYYSNGTRITYNVQTANITMPRNSSTTIVLDPNPVLGTLNVSIQLPTDNTAVTQNQTFTINATVSCVGEDNAWCGEITALARYNASGATPDTKINTTAGATPFYIHKDLNIKNTTYNGFNFSVASQDTDVTSLAFNGTNFYVGGSTDGTVFEYYANGTYTGFNFSTSGQTSPNGLAFNGTYFYVGGPTAVFEYYANGTYTGFNFSTSGQDANSGSLAFNGTNFYVSGGNTKRIYGYYANGTYTGFNFSFADQSATGVIAFNETNFYVGGSDKGFFEYNATGSYTGFNFSTSGQDTSPTGLVFNKTNFYMLGAFSKAVYGYDAFMAVNPKIGPGYNVTEGESFTIGWVVNATGSPASYEIDVLFNSTTYYQNITANDTADRTITIATDVAPTVTILYPQNITYNVNVSQLNYTAEDDVLSACWYSLNGGANSTPDFAPCANFSGLFSNEGSNTWTVYANDSLNQIGSASVTFFKDTVNPLIQFENPTEANNTYFNRNWIFVNVSITEANRNITKFDLYFSNFTLANSTQFSDSTNSLNFTSLAEGRYYYNVTVNDSAGNTNSTETRTITLDTIKPSIFYNANTDTDNSFVNRNWVFVNITASDTNRDTVKLSWNGTNQSFTNNTFTNLFWENKTSLADSPYTFYAWVNDSANNVNSTATRTVTVDTKNPLIDFITPTEANNTNFSRTWIFVNVSITEANFENVTFSLFFSNGTTKNITTFTDSRREINFTSLNDGTYLYNVTTFDKASRTNNTETRLTRLDTTVPATSFVAPTENSGVKRSRNYIEINVTATDSLVGLDKIVIRLYNSTNQQINSSTTSTSPNFINFTGLSEGVYFYNATANDTVGNANNTETRNITLDTVKPNVQFVANTETSGSFKNTNTINVNVTATDTNLEKITIFLYNSTPMQIRSNQSATSPHNITYSGLADGIYYFNATANDTANNVNSTETRNVTIDTVNPLIDYVSPTEANNTNFSRTWIFVNVSITETNFQNVTFRLHFSNGTPINTTTFTDATRSLNFTSLSDGTYLFNVTTFDKASRTNSTATRLQRLDTTGPNVQFVNPTENSGVFKNQNFINVNVTASDSLMGLSTITIRLFNSTGNQLRANTTTNSTFFINYTGLANGLYFYNSTANDTLNNQNSTETRNITLDTTKPSIFYNPSTDANNAFVSRNWVFVNVTANDTNRDTVLLQFDGTNQSFTNNTFVNLFWENKTSLSDGAYSFFAWVNDSANNVNSTATRTVTVDTTKPTIQFVSPTETNGSQLTRNFIQVNVTAGDTNLGTITTYLYFVNGTLFKSRTNATSPAFNNFTNLADEIYLFNATINDSAGNTNQTETRQVSTDTGAPTMSYVAPTETNNTFLNRNFIRVNVTASDPNLDKIIIKLFFSNGTQANSNTTSTSPNFANFTGLAEGQYKFNASANDTFGNTANLGTRNVTLDTTKPSITNIAESPSDPATYVAGATYRFNATITDTNLDKVLIEFDGTNYTPSNFFGGGIYNFTITDLAAGVHNYYWFANDSAANVNVSVQTYTINNATGNITLLINGSAANQSGTYGLQTNASASTLFGTVNLFRNGTNVNSQNNAFVTLAVGFYNYTAVSTGDQNHSSASATLFVTISKAQSVVNLTLNGTDGNVTIVQDSEIYLNVTTITGDAGATLRLYKDGTLINEGTSPISNLTAFGSVGVFNITGFYIESENYTGSFETWYVNVTETPDTTAPSVTSLTERPSDPATYSPGQVYEFNATVTDARNVNVVRIDFNGTNYSVTNYSGNVYNFTISDLAVGTYNYRWYANDSAGNMNGTMNGSYTINQNTTALTLTITPSTTVTYPTETTALGSGCPSQITCTLYRNGVDVGSSTDVKTLAAATYNYTYNTTGNANYTADSETTNLTVNKNGGACNVLFNATSPLTYPSTFLVYTDCTSAFTLSRNGTSISNNSEQALGVSAYNFSVQRTDTQNYTNTFDQEQFIINKGTGLVFTYLNNSRANITIEQQTAIYLNGTLETGVGNIKFYRNNTLINQGASPLSNLTNFTVIGSENISTIYDGNENYTSAIETWYVIVTELDVTPPNISILHPQNISYSSVRTQLNYTVADNFALDKCWYSLNGGATNITVTCGTNVSGLDSGQGSSTWRVYANDTKGNQNSSNVTFFVDSVNPAASFVSPTETNGTRLGRNFIRVNVSATDTNFNTITVRLYNSTNHQIRINTSTENPFFINYTGLAEGNYSFNATANDTLNNLGSTETRTVSLERPSLAILRPENETYFNNISLQLNFTVELQDSIRYNIDNTTNTTITGNTTFNTTTGLHTLYLFANNSVGTTSKNVTFTVNISRFKVIYTNYKNNGSTTEFNISSYEDIQNLSGVILENTNYGKISFNQAINITNDSDSGDNILDLDINTNISQNNITLNTTAIPNFNKTATLSLYGLTFSDPRVLRDGEVCPSTICTEVSYSGGTFIFNVTQFTSYSAEETPSAAVPSGGGGPSVGGGVRQCVNNSQCGEFENCINGFCIKLFDIKILEFESPAALGDFFDFTYFIKAVTTINNDVIISFWIENQEGEKITSGSDTIYIGGFGEEKTGATKIFLPSNLKSGVYSFFIEVSYEGYFARSQRTIEVQVKEGRITISPINLSGLKTFVIAFLMLLAAVILVLIVYKERKKIEREIEHGFKQEARFLRRLFKGHKVSVLTFLLILVVGLLFYLVGFYEFVALKLSEAILWFKVYSTYIYYALLGLILLVLIASILRNKGVKERFHEWRKRRSIESFFERKYSSGVREAGKVFSGAIKIPEKKSGLASRLFSRVPFFSQELQKETSELSRREKIFGLGLGEEISKIGHKVNIIGKKFGREVRKVERSLAHGTRATDEETDEEIGQTGKKFGRGIRKVGKSIGRGLSHGAEFIGTGLKKIGKATVKEIDVFGEKISEIGKGAFEKAKTAEKELEKEIGRAERAIPGIASEVPKVISDIEKIDKRTHKVTKVQEKDVTGFFSVFGGGIKKASGKIGRFFRREERETASKIRTVEREIPQKLKAVGETAAEEKRKIGRETERIIKTSGRAIDQIYKDVASLLSKAFGRRTRKIVLEDFEKHFEKRDEKIAKKHEKTIKEIIQLKEALAKKKIAGISREFEAEVKYTRKRAAELIYDLVEHLKNSSLISSPKERKRVEKRAKMYEHEISFMKRLPEKIEGFFKRIKSEIPKQKKSEFKNPFSLNIGKNVFKTNKNQGFKNPFDIPSGRKKRRKPW